MPPSPPLICHVIYRLAVGGLENGVVNIVNNLPATDFRHTIVCVTETTDFRQRIRRPDVEIHELRKRAGKDVGAYRRMWRLMRQLRPDIVHTRNLPALDMIVPARLAGVPHFVHSEHGLDLMEIDGRHAKYNALRRASRLVVDRYVAMSRDLREWLAREIGVPEARLQTIYNGVDTARFTPEGDGRAALPEGFAPPDALVIGTFGRLDPMKNQAALIEAFARIIGERPEWRARLRLVVVGEGGVRPQLEAAIAAAGIGDLVWLAGLRNDTPRLYRALDIFVLPSLREGISNTLLEAMASAVPVITTAVGGNPEIVPDGVAGQLVPPADAPAIAAALRAYLDDPPLLRRHGEGGRAHVLENFSLEAMLGGYQRLYGGMCPARP
jgi:sugar transferase (PEP-CTERM/EpsH1 system associated)